MAIKVATVKLGKRLISDMTEHVSLKKMMFAKNRVIGNI